MVSSRFTRIDAIRDQPVTFYKLCEVTVNLCFAFVKLGTRIYPSLGLASRSFAANLPKPGEQTMKRIFAKFLADESGATAIEYGLIAAGISLAIIAAVNGLGTTLNTKFTDINSSLK